MFGLDPFYDTLLRGSLLTLTGLLWVTLTVRFIGPRAFSKMTAFDFVVTLATGSLLSTAASASSWTAFGQCIVAILVLLVAQFLLALGRKNSSAFKRGLENAPILLVENGEFNETAMAKSRVARADIVAKLREANALRLTQVRAVILETTGDISVLHGEGCDEVLLEGVRR